MATAAEACDVEAIRSVQLARGHHVTFLPVGTLDWSAVATYEDALAQVCRPVAGRTSELGCWIIQRTDRQSLQASAVSAFRHLSDTGSGRSRKDAIKYGCGGVRKNVVVDHCRHGLAASKWGPRCGNRPAAGDRRGDLRSAVYGSRFRAWNDRTLSPSSPCCRSSVA